MIFALLIIVQLAILFGTICFLEEYSGRIYGFLTFFGICVTLWLVSKDDNPSYKLAWVVLILILPVFGVLFYLIFGNKSMPQKMHKRISQSMEYEKSLLSNDFVTIQYHFNCLIAEQPRHLISLWGQAGFNRMD